MKKIFSLLILLFAIAFVLASCMPGGNAGTGSGTGNGDGEKDDEPVSFDVTIILKGDGIDTPNLIVTAGAALIGAVSGITARFIVKKKGRKQIILSGALAHVTGSMIIKTIGLYQFYGILVLWRIPLYLVIASVEIFIICLLFDRASFRRAVGYIGGEKS